MILWVSLLCFFLLRVGNGVFVVLTRDEFAYIFHPKINLFLSTTIKINLKIPFEDPHELIFGVWFLFCCLQCLCNFFLRLFELIPQSILSHPSTTVAGWSFPSFSTKGFPKTKVFYKYVNCDLSSE